MASEISVSSWLTFTKNGITVHPSWSPVPLQFTMTGTDHILSSQNVGFAAEEALLLGDITTPGWAIFKNRDATNYIVLRSATGVTTGIRIPATAVVGPIYFQGSAPYVIADTGACILDYLIVEA